MNNSKNYLPSRKFITIVLIIIVSIILFLTIRELFSFLKSKASNKDAPLEVAISEIGQTDSNNNGIADWEEYMWGLNPKSNGKANKELIDSKKKALNQNGLITNDSTTLSQNELVSRQFFATIISLQQTGELDAESMNSVSEALGGVIDVVPIDDIYTSKMLTLQNDSEATKEAYRSAFGALVTKYENANIGSELTFIIQGISNKDPQALYAAKTVGDSYVAFGKDLMSIPVPRALATLHTSMANNYDKTGKVIIELTQMLSDPLIGMKSIVNYKKYNDALVSDLEKVSEFLQ